MVTLSLGARWQEKMQQLAELKLEKREVEDALQSSQEQVQTLQTQLNETQISHEEIKIRLQDALEQLNCADSVTRNQESAVETMYSNLSEKTERVKELEGAVHVLQERVDATTKELNEAKGLITKLQKEVAEGDRARSRLEEERDYWKSQYDKKTYDLALVQRAKEHTEKHVAILVKEKDRLLGKKPEVSPVLSQQHAQYEWERPVTAPAPDSYSEVEILRLRKALMDEKEKGAAKEKELEKLKNENWNLITRLRNGRK